MKEWNLYSVNRIDHQRDVRADEAGVEHFLAL